MPLTKHMELETALEEAGFPTPQAQALAGLIDAIDTCFDTLETSVNELRNDVSDLRQDTGQIRIEIYELRSQVDAIRNELNLLPWRTAALFALFSAIVLGTVKLFLL